MINHLTKFLICYRLVLKPCQKNLLSVNVAGFQSKCYKFYIPKCGLNNSHNRELILYLLKVKQVSREPEDDCQLLSHSSTDVPAEGPARKNMVNVVLLFATAVLYGSSVGGAIEILGSFVLKEPLSWNATQVTFCPSLYLCIKYFICDIDACKTTGLL